MASELSKINVGVVESRPTGVWSGLSGGLYDSEELGLSGLGLMDVFVSQPAVGAPSLFTGSKGHDSFEWISCRLFHRNSLLLTLTP